MKKYIILIICSGFFLLFPSSCLKSYLDKAPASGLTEADVFSKYENFKNFFEAVYTGTKGLNFNIKPGFSNFFNAQGHKFTWDALTDNCDMGRLMWGQQIKGGQIMSVIDAFTNGGTPILSAMFIIIRTSNMALEHMPMLQDATQADKDDITAQAHFVRAFAHFTLFKIWGPMPYLTKALGPDDQWDIPRLSKHETLMKISADLDTAIIYYTKANKMRRDNPVSGGAGHLNNPDQFKPNGCAAMGLKGRVLLYAASPQNNELGAKDWENAAKANWEAIKTAEQWGYFLLSANDYKLNYVGTDYSDEQLYGYAAGNQPYNSTSTMALVNGVFSASKSANSGECPTQNLVDLFETKYGDPLNTEADRAAAIAAGHYKDQDPYANRDPRFYIDIIYNTAPIPGYTTAKIYYQMVNGLPVWSELLDHLYLGITQTGYYTRKTWGDQSVMSKVTPMTTDPVIRLGELYLNYAEAANEAYGPNGKAPGADLTAAQAINKIRTRVGMPDVLPQYTTSAEVFRQRIKTERNVELCFEGHRYFDIRRWKDAPKIMSGTLMGMDVEKVTTSSTYPTGYKYTRVPLPSARQVYWKDEMYYWPFPVADNYKMKKFVPNPIW